MTDGRSQMAENALPFVLCHLFSVLCPLYPPAEIAGAKERSEAIVDGFWFLKIGLPKDKWRGVVINADMPFRAVG